MIGDMGRYYDFDSTRLDIRENNKAIYQKCGVVVDAYRYCRYSASNSSTVDFGRGR